MRRFIAMLWVAAATITALGLFQVKQDVVRLEAEMRHELRVIEQHRETLRILEAEWSYLNRPARIADLAQRHLNLGPLPAEATVQFEDLPLRQPPASPDGPPDAELPQGATLASARTEQ